MTLGALPSQFSAVFALGVGKGFSVIAWTVFLWLAGKNLTKSDYGLLLLLANFASFTVIFGTLGQPQVLLFRSGRLGSSIRTFDHHNNLFSGLKITAVMTLFSTVFVGILIYIKGAVSYWIIIAWIFWTACSCFQAIMAEEARTVSRMWVAGFASNSAAAGGAGVLIIALLIIIFVNFYSHQLNLGTYLFSLAAASAIFSIWLLAMYVKALDSYPFSLKSQSEKARGAQPNQIWQSGLLSTAITILTFIIGLSDLWWASAWYSIEVAGAYGTASYLARFCSIFGILIASAYAAKFSAMLAQGNNIAVALKVKKLALLSTAVGFIVWLFFAAAINTGILNLFFNLDVKGGTTALLILGIGHVCGCFFGLAPVLLASTGHFKDLLTIACGAAIASTLLAFCAVQIGGLESLASAFCLGYLIFVFWCHKACKKLLGVSPFNTTLEISKGR